MHKNPQQNLTSEIVIGQGNGSTHYTLVIIRKNKHPMPSLSIRPYFIQILHKAVNWADQCPATEPQSEQQPKTF